MIDSTIPLAIEALNGELRQLAVETWHAACRLPVACDAWSAWYQELRTAGDADPRVLRRASETVIRSVECLTGVVCLNKAREIQEIADKLPGLPTFRMKREALLDPVTGETLTPAYPGWQHDPDILVNFYGNSRSEPLDFLVGHARHVREMLREAPASFLSDRELRPEFDTTQIRNGPKHEFVVFHTGLKRELLCFASDENEARQAFASKCPGVVLSELTVLKDQFPRHPNVRFPSLSSFPPDPDSIVDLKAAEPQTLNELAEWCARCLTETDAIAGCGSTSEIASRLFEHVRRLRREDARLRLVLPIESKLPQAANSGELEDLLTVLLDKIPKGAPGTASPEESGKQNRGRPTGTTKNDPKKDKRLFEAWKTGAYKSKADVDTELGIPLGSTVSAVDRHRQKLATEKNRAKGE